MSVLKKLASRRDVLTAVASFTFGLFGWAKRAGNEAEAAVASRGPTKATAEAFGAMTPGGFLTSDQGYDERGNGNAVKLVEILKSTYWPESEGATDRWGVDNTQALNRAAEYAADQGRTLKINRRYTLGGEGLRLKSGARLEGNGGGSGTANDEAAASLVSLSGAPADHAVISLFDGNVVGVELHELRINGNKSNQSAPCRGVVIDNGAGVGGGSFKPRHRLRGLTIVQTSGDGLSIGNYTRDSVFTDILVYGADGYGVFDAGVDSERSNLNIGQSGLDGYYCTANAIRMQNIKSWGSGQYQKTGPRSQSANFRFRACRGVTADTLYSQEASGFGFDFSGREDAPLSGIVARGLISDADNVANLPRAGINIYSVKGAIIDAHVGKLYAGLAGAPHYGVTLAGGTRDCNISVTTEGVVSWDIDISGDSSDNSFVVNGNRGKLSVVPYTRMIVPNPFDSERYYMMLSGPLRVESPTKRARGLRIGFIFAQDERGGHSVDFGPDFRLGWHPVTEPLSINSIDFVSDGTSWLQTSSTAMR